MENFDVLQDIAERTGGDIYLGVVGPVRTGKSTFIKGFMESLVLPNILDIHERERALDEMPQSGGGRTVMTSEPKFVPAEAVRISMGEGIEMQVGLVDCVGYTVPGALGFDEDEEPRMVSTPWFDEAIPFAEAAEIGTRKVITDHSTIGLVVLTDGSFGDIPLDNYLGAEERVIGELKELGKPFVIVLNSLHPQSMETQAMAAQVAAKYDVETIPANAANMSYDDLMKILRAALYEFPVAEININLPSWIDELEKEHWLRKALEEGVSAAVGGVKRVRDIGAMLEGLNMEGLTEGVQLVNMELGRGIVTIVINMAEGMFYRILGEYAGEEITDDQILLRKMRAYSTANREWSKISSAMEEVYEHGYGVVSPSVDDMYLEEPELIKQGGRFGVRLQASAASYHIIRANISTEITPLIGSEKQCEELVRYMLDEFEDDPQKIWQTNIFGKSLHELASEGISSKLYRMPENAQNKLQTTLQRIVDDGGGGLICIIL